MNEPPICPKHGPMTHGLIECYDRVLGCLWACTVENCDECQDCDCTPMEPPQPQQIGMFDNVGQL